MKIRCSNPACLSVIKFQQGHVEVDGKKFCSSPCAEEYVEQANKFDAATQRFRPRERASKHH